jgi:two-component system chemotaxis sensor kinase CheA
VGDFQVSAELLNIFLEDARGHLEALDRGLLGLEREGLDPETMTGLLGPLHTLKGNSGMLGFSGIKDYVHRLEDVLGRMRDGQLDLSPVLFDRLFAGASALRDAVEKACQQSREVRDLSPEQAALDALLKAGPTAPAAAPVARRAAVDTQHVAARSNMVRVDFAQLDHLLNLVGELVVYRTKLQEVGKEAASLLPGQEVGRSLLDTVHQITGVSSQLQETIMDIRMLPMRHVFERFPRLVRDLARQQGKEIELILEGEETRVDKAIIDEVGEPLVHMIRNSVDHGIETPARRVAKGKTATGTILLSAAQESNQVVITIMDDGAGIDAAQVRGKAVARGLIKADENLSDREVVQLIFAEGLSTAEAVTDLSGRGVGLDVVVKSIERLNGLVEAETVPGVGTKFIIQLPLTLAIISALMVEVGGRTYAIPLGSVVESLKFRPEDVTRMNGRDTLRLRERIIPLSHLAELFGQVGGAGREGGYAVILGRGEKRLGLAVDRLQGQQEVVIKALDPTVTSVTFAVAGATILGDGRVVLILDVAALFEGKRKMALGGAAALAGGS